jgi:hypothetical protein
MVGMLPPFKPIHHRHRRIDLPNRPGVSEEVVVVEEEEEEEATVGTLQVSHIP